MTHGWKGDRTHCRPPARPPLSARWQVQDLDRNRAAVSPTRPAADCLVLREEGKPPGSPAKRRAMREVARNNPCPCPSGRETTHRDDFPTRVPAGLRPHSHLPGTWAAAHRSEVCCPELPVPRGGAFHKTSGTSRHGPFDTSARREHRLPSLSDAPRATQ
jgi:hypothetical protein